MKRICRYLQGTKYNGLVFNPSKKLDVDCYANKDFAGLWGYVDPQDPICVRSRTGFVVTIPRMTAHQSTLLSNIIGSDITLERNL